MILLYILLAWLIISLIIITICLKADYFDTWMLFAFIPGVLLFYLFMLIREFYYKIICQIKRQENKYNQRL